VRFVSGPGREGRRRAPGPADESGIRSYERGSYASAEESFKDALESAQAADPESRETERALYWLASAYYANGKYAEAERSMDRAREIGEVRLSSEFADLDLMLDRQAEVYVERGRYLEAEAVLLQSLRIKQKKYGQRSEEVADTLNGLGVIYYHADDFDHAESAFAQALRIRREKLGPDHASTATIQNNLGALYNKMGKHEKAYNLLKRALTTRKKIDGGKGPEVAATLDNIGNCFLAIGDLDQAQGYYQNALQADPDYWRASHNLATVDYRRAELDLGEGDAVRAASYLNRAINGYRGVVEKAPNPESFTDLAAALLKLVQIKKNPETKADLVKLAEQCYERAIDLAPRDHRAYVHLAFLRFEQGKKRQALELFDRAIAVAPHESMLYYFKAHVLEEQGREGEALMTYEACLEIAPCQDACRAGRLSLLKKRAELTPEPGES